MNRITGCTILMAVILPLIPLTLLAQWKQTSGPPGISINIFYNFNGFLYAGTSSKGVFKSRDNGATWNTANTGIENLQVKALVSNGQALYAGTNHGVFVSLNGGNNWLPANSQMENKIIASFLVTNGYLFAGTIGQGLYKSSDNGKTWTDASGNALSVSTIYAITSSQNNLVVVADNQIFYSMDNGNSWNYDFSSPFIFGLAGFVTKDDSVIVHDGDQVFRSFDRGITWGRSILVNRSAILSGMVMESETLFAGGRTGIYWSKDFGSTWKAIPTDGLKIGELGSFQSVDFNNTFSSSGKNFLLGYDEVGVAYSTDTGRTWTYTVSGFPPASSIDNALLGVDSVLYSGTHGDGLYETVNNGKDWRKITTGDNHDSLANANIFAVLKTGNVILAGTCSYGLYRSIDNGVSWTRIHNGLPADNNDLLCINSLAKTNTNILAATSKGLYFSSDAGFSWKPTTLTGDNLSVDAVAANGAVAVAAVAHFTGTNNLYRSEDNGVSWTSVLSVVDDFTCASSDGNSSFYVGSFSGGYRSLNNGKLWTSFGSGLPPTATFTIAVKGKNVFVGNVNGVFYSTNQGNSFVQKSEGLDSGESRSVQGLGVRGRFLYAGTFRDAVWIRPLSDFASATIDAGSIPAEKVTVSIFPNPAKNIATVNYEVPQYCTVSIDLFDATGNKLKTVINESKGPGSYQLAIPLYELSPGLYFVKIQLGQRNGFTKLIVIK